MRDRDDISSPHQRAKSVKGKERAMALKRVAIPNNVINSTEIEMRGEWRTAKLIQAEQNYIISG